MKLKLKSRRQLSLEELWAIEDKFPAVCGPSPSSYAARHGLKLSKSYLQHLSRRRANGNGKHPVSRRGKLAPSLNCPHHHRIFAAEPNEAAFYGPKIDVQVWSVIGREFTLATNQVDFAVPARFGLTYRDKDNSNKTPLCIHRAPLGTHERFIGFLIEHYAGNFPLWLAPDQVRVITLNDDAALIDYTRPIVNELRANMVRVDANFSATPFKAKIADAEQQRVHTMLVIGGRDMEAGAVSVRLQHGGPQGAKPKAEVIADILASIKERRA